MYYKTVQINCCRKVFCVTANPCVSTSVPLTYVWAFGFVGCILFDCVNSVWCNIWCITGLYEIEHQIHWLIIIFTKRAILVSRQHPHISSTRLLVMYIYIYIHIRTHIHTYIHTYIHVRTYVHTYRQTDIHTCTYVRTYIQTDRHTYIHVRTYIQTDRHTCIHTCLSLSLPINH